MRAGLELELQELTRFKNFGRARRLAFGFAFKRARARCRGKINHLLGVFGRGRASDLCRWSMAFD